MHNPGDGHDPATTDISETTSGLSRRSLMRSAVGAGAATVAAGFLVSALAEPAAAAPTTEGAAAHTEPVVAHVRDARTGDIDLFVGTRHVQVRDHDLAARLANAAR